jgi:NADPH-dependent curcumin reductase CurA
MDGRAVGRVVESRAPGFAPGDLVRSKFGWREAYVASPDGLEKLGATYAHPTHYLSALGSTGLTACVGLLDLCDPQPGETVFVSGAVGSIAGQLARVRGCHVIGSAGSDDKVRALRDQFRFHEAFNYKTSGPGDALTALAPDGIDVYFDNVGGRHLEAALDALNDFGSIAACGNDRQLQQCRVRARSQQPR